MTEAILVLAPGATILQASSLDELAAQFKTIKGPVKNLDFAAHMTEDGDLLFDAPGTMNFVPAEKIV